MPQCTLVAQHRAQGQAVDPAQFGEPVIDHRGVQCQGPATPQKSWNRRIVATWAAIVPTDRFRAICWCDHPVTIASNTAASGRRTAMPSANCSRADPGGGS